MKRVLSSLALILVACGREGLPAVTPTSSGPRSPTESTQRSLAPSLATAPSPSTRPGAELSAPGTRGVVLGASNAESASAGPRSAGAPSFSTYCAARDASGTIRPVVSGDTLRSGDHFWLELAAHEPLYVYVVYVAAGGSANVLYPSTGDLLLAPGHVQRLPEAQDFELDQQPGLERLIVVASRDVLGRSASSLAELVNRVRTTHRLPGEVKASRPKSAARVATGAALPSVAPAQRAASPEPYQGPTTTLEPAYAGVNTRGIVLSGSPRGRIDVVPDSDGVIAIPLLIEHAP
jgi:hypothetical protein